MRSTSTLLFLLTAVAGVAAAQTAATAPQSPSNAAQAVTAAAGANTNGTLPASRYAKTPTETGVKEALSAARAGETVLVEPTNQGKDFPLNPYFGAVPEWLPDNSTVLDEQGGQHVLLRWHPTPASPFTIANAVMAMFGTAGADTAKNSQGSRRYGNLNYTSFTGPGISEGPPWTVSHSNLMLTTSSVEGIKQNLLMRFRCNGVGDCANLYVYQDTDAGMSASNDEGVSAYSSQLNFTGGATGVVVRASAAGPSTIYWKEVRQYAAGDAPGGGHLITSLAGHEATSEFYVTSLPRTLGNLEVSKVFPWEQILQVSTTSPVTGAAYGSTMPAVSGAFGTVVSCSTDAPYMGNNGTSAVPQPRQCKVALNTAVLRANAFAVAGGLVCISAGGPEVATLQSASPVVAGEQTITFMSRKRMSIGPKAEIWQGGPCGQAALALQGDSIATAVNRNVMVITPIMGSPAPGYIAVNTSFLGGQQGPGYGLMPHGKLDIASGTLKLTRKGNVVTITAPSPDVGNAGLSNSMTRPLPEKVVLKQTAADPSFLKAIPFVPGTPPLKWDTSVRRVLGDRNAASYTQPGSNADAETTGTISVVGWDNIAIMNAAEVIGAGDPTVVDGSGVIPLTLAPNSLEALADGAPMNSGVHWHPGGTGMRNWVLDATGEAFGTGLYNPCWGGDNLTCVSISLRGMGGSAENQVQNSPRAGLVIDGPTPLSLLLPGPVKGGTAINVGCPGGSLNPRCDTNVSTGSYGLLKFNAARSGGVMSLGWNVSSTNGSQQFLYNQNGAPMPWVNVYSAGDANPMRPDVTLPADGSQSIQFPAGLSARTIGLLYPASGYVEALQPTGTANIDPAQAVTLGTLTNRAKFTSNATGEVHVGALEADVSARLADATAGSPAPVAVAPEFGRGMTVTPSGGNTGRATRQYHLTCSTAAGETNFDAQSAHIGVALQGQAAKLSPSASNTVVLPSVYTSADCTGYNLYVVDNAAGPFYLGSGAAGATIVDTGAVRVSGRRTFRSRNISSTFSAARLELLGTEGICWLTNAEQAAPTKLAPCMGRITESGSGVFSLDKAAPGDGQAAVIAGSYREKLYTPPSSSAPCTTGQFADDANYHYVCVATNTWKRVALSSF